MSKSSEATPSAIKRPAAAFACSVAGAAAAAAALQELETQATQLLGAAEADIQDPSTGNLPCTLCTNANQLAVAPKESIEVDFAEEEEEEEQPVKPFTCDMRMRLFLNEKKDKTGYSKCSKGQSNEALAAAKQWALFAAPEGS